MNNCNGNKRITKTRTKREFEGIGGKKLKWFLFLASSAKKSQTSISPYHVKFFVDPQILAISTSNIKNEGSIG